MCEKWREMERREDTTDRNAKNNNNTPGTFPKEKKRTKGKPKGS